MIVFSDVHLKESSVEVVLGEVLPGLREACQQMGYDKAACLGDFFHLRYQVDARIQNSVLDEFRLWGKAGIKILMLPGNHDQYEVGGRNVLEVFGELDNVQVFTEPTWTPEGLWIPYRKHKQVVRDALNLARPAKAFNYVFVHLPIEGAMMNDHKMNTDGVPVGWFRGFDRVFSGHYHKRQMLAKNQIIYVGSPWQTKADEAGQPKGCGVLDFTRNDFRWIDTVWGPRFHKFTVEAGQSPDTKCIGVRDQVSVTVTGEGAERHAEAVYKQLVEQCGGTVRAVVTPEIQATQARLDVGVGADILQYVQAYVQQQKGSLDPTMLFHAFREITGLEVV